MAGVTKAAKTSNSTPKCMWILERGELRSKSKSLAQQAFLPLIRQKSKIFATFSPKRRLWRASNKLLAFWRLAAFLTRWKPSQMARLYLELGSPLSSSKSRSSRSTNPSSGHIARSPFYVLLIVYAWGCENCVPIWLTGNKILGRIFPMPP